MDQTQALLIRRTRFGDTSLILTWFTERYGLVKTIAKGALRPKSPLFGKVDLFFQCDITVTVAKKGDLHALRELHVIAPFEGIRTSYLRALVSSYFSELLAQGIEFEHPMPELFHLALRAFGYLNETEPTIRSVHYFEEQFCKMIELETGQIPVNNILHRRLSALLGGRIPDNRGVVLAKIEENIKNNP